MIRPFRGDYILTQGFGGNPGDYAKFGLLGHNGLDYGLPLKTQVIAPHSGKVIEAASDPTGYGNYLKIENDIEGSVLAHLDSFQVSVGQTVNEGQPIGLSNNSGNSTGPHLHWGYYKFPRNRQNGYAGFINQLPLISVPPVITPLPLPNPGYAPTFEGQTVSKDGLLYQSYVDSGKLLWRSKPEVPQVETDTARKAALWDQVEKLGFFSIAALTQELETLRKRPASCPPQKDNSGIKKRIIDAANEL